MLTSLVAGASALVVPGVRRASGAPTVNVKNGTISGVHSSTYNQDFFLGCVKRNAIDSR